MQIFDDEIIEKLNDKIFHRSILIRFIKKSRHFNGNSKNWKFKFKTTVFEKIEHIFQNKSVIALILMRQLKSLYWPNSS